MFKQNLLNRLATCRPPRSIPNPHTVQNNRTTFVQSYLSNPVGAASLTLIGLFLVFGQLLSIGHRFPEYPLFYGMNMESGLDGWIQAYNPFQGGWYRPTAFRAYFQLITSAIGWQQFAAFQWIALFFQFLLSLSGYLLASRALGLDRISSALAGLAIAVHPVFFMVQVDLTHFDLLYQFFSVLAIALWIRGNRVGLARSLVVGFLSVIALTSKEQAVVLPVALLWIMLVDRLFDGSFSKYRTIQAGTLLFLLFGFSLLIIVTRILYMTDSADAAYRTGWSPGIVLENTRAAALWIFRIFLFDTSSWPEVRYYAFSKPGFLLGLVFVVSSLYYVLSSLRHPESRRTVLYLLGIMMIFFALPVYSGGRPWHFGVPAIAASLLAVAGFRQLWDRCFSSPSARSMGYVLFVLLLVGSSLIELSSEQARRESPSRILKSAMENPPRPSQEVPPGQWILYAHKDPSARWAFGSGYLWRYVYQRPDLHELTFPSIAGLDSAQLSQIPDLDSIIIYDYNPHQRPAWTEVTDTVKPVLKNRVEGKEGPFPDSFNFREEDYSGQILSGNWSGIEPWGRWILGEGAGIRMAGLERAGGDAELVVNWIPFITKNHPVLEMSLSINGALVREFRFTWPEDAKMHEDTVRIPSELLDSQSNRVVFSIVNAASPAELKTGVDERKLGVGLAEIQLISVKAMSKE